jgi:hypothetical protein
VGDGIAPVADSWIKVPACPTQFLHLWIRDAADELLLISFYFFFSFIFAFV